MGLSILHLQYTERLITLATLFALFFNEEKSSTKTVVFAIRDNAMLPGTAESFPVINAVAEALIERKRLSAGDVEAFVLG